MRVTHFIAICCVGIVCFGGVLFAQEGFTGPHQSNVTTQIDLSRSGQIVPMTVSQVMNYQHDTAVLLVGNIINSVRKDIYTFKDNSGEILIKVGSKDWKGLSVSPSDRLIISGHVKQNRANQVEIDVKTIIKG